jgi:1,4-alpha-glucan branching enzyme
LQPRGQSGIWEGWIPGAKRGQRYKYRIAAAHGYQVDKADPYGVWHETPPHTASVIWDRVYPWADAAWMAQRRQQPLWDRPVSIYEVHLGSWRRVPEEGNRSLSYREIARPLAAYVQEMGFTHVELMPVMEHPFYGSWGYQTTGYFAPTSRYGTPQDFMALIDYLHQQGIGVILDWVPSHFPSDEHGLASFDGTHLYEHADPRQGFHPDWQSLIFNYNRHEVRCFLLSSALCWIEQFHADALRVDAVASMLYLDYSRLPGEWVPNLQGGRENLEALHFLQQLSGTVGARHPEVALMAEESTAWSGVSRPASEGGLGFTFKWDMGWMHDTLRYLARDPIHRRHHQGELPFRMVYAFTEQFVLPLSHDEVANGKGSLLAQMPGDDGQRFANLRLLLGYQYTQPGKKLLFMGTEWGQWQEWRHEASLEWHQLQHAPHAGIQRWVRDLNQLYQREPALSRHDLRPEGFEWIDHQDAASSVLCFLRRGAPGDPLLLVVCHFTPVLRTGYRVGVPQEGVWRELLNSDAGAYGGSGAGNYGQAVAEAVPCHGRPHSLALTLPPLSVLIFRCEAGHGS